MAKDKQHAAPPRYTCRECAHCYDWHERDYEGRLFLCRCRVRPYSRFLHAPQCEKFELTDNDDGPTE